MILNGINVVDNPYRSQICHQKEEGLAILFENLSHEEMTELIFALANPRE